MIVESLLSFRMRSQQNDQSACTFLRRCDLRWCMVVFLVNSYLVWVAGVLTAYLSLWTLAYLFWNISVNLVSHCCASLCGKTAVIDRYHAWIRHSLTILATVAFQFPPSKMLLAVLWNTQWPFQSLSITGNQLTYCTQSSYFLLLTFTPSSRFCLSGNCWGDSSFTN